MKQFIACLVCLAGVQVALSAEPESKTVNGVTYRIVRTKPATVRVFWKDGNGKAMRTFPEVTKEGDRLGLRISTLMNGGIFEPGGIPSGLLVQSGKELNPVNRRDGNGNFFLKPNGIFLVGAAGAAVIRTEEYPPQGVTVRDAVQSGPLLLRQGRIHPVFRAESTSRLHRNGVGVDKNGDVVFAMSDSNSPKFPNLHEFARLFLHLGCDDALFLDGDISQMRWDDGIRKPSNLFGSTIAVVETDAGGSK